MYSTNKVVVKLYDKDSTFKRTLSGTYLSTFPSFTETLGYWLGPLSFRYSVAYDNNDIEHLDIIKVVSSDGTVLYTGVVIGIKRVVASGGEYQDIKCNWLQTYLKRTMYDEASSFTFTKTDDAATIIKDIIDTVNDKYTPDPFSYTASTVIDTGVTISVDFDYNDCQEALNAVLALTDYNFRIWGDGVVYFYPKDSGYNGEHKLTFGKHVESLELEEWSNDLVNSVIVEYKTGVIAPVEDATSKTAYGTLDKYIYDTAIANSATATERATAELESFKNPELSIKIVVNDTYDIDSLHVGDVVTILNINYSIVWYTINKVDYKTNKAIIYLDGFTSIAKSFDKLLKL